jgi:serine phosphatase RsbU (regulator of sigma subunit)
MRGFIIFFLFLFLLSTYSKAATEDSLLTLYTEAKNDSLKAERCDLLSAYYEDINLKESVKWIDKMVLHAKKSKDDRLVLRSLSYSNYYYHLRGNYQRAIEKCLEAIKIADKIKDGKHQASFSVKIGTNYAMLEENEKAISWLKKGIPLCENHYLAKLPILYSGLSTVYVNREEFDSALVYQNLTLELREKEGDSLKIATAMGNIGLSYVGLKRFKEAESILLKSYHIRKDVDSPGGKAKIALNLSQLYSFQDENKKSNIYADTSYQISVRYGFREYQYQSAKQLAVTYYRLGNYERSADYWREVYDQWKIMHEEEAAEKLSELQTIYETEKIEGQNLALRKDSEIKDLKIEKADTDLKNQRFVIWVVVAGLLIAVGFVFLLVSWNKKKKETNLKLQIQNNEIEEQNREIKDSISYAKRIQNAILPPVKIVKEYLQESFILYKPKDIVAGDFYWMEHKNNKVLFEAADCTGHGVPGAMVSVVCNNALNRSVREHGLTDPGEILTKTREIVIREFEKSEEDVKDGMDIALCSLEGNKLQYAGAHNPLWIIRKGEIIETKANKQPIGKFDNPEPYTTHNFDLEQGDSLYIFSDGYVDQFGGEKGKKFKARAFRELLLSIQDKSMEEQKQIIDEAFETWKGDLEQIDDVCVIGVRV